MLSLALLRNDNSRAVKILQERLNKNQQAFQSEFGMELGLYTFAEVMADPVTGKAVDPIVRRETENVPV